MSALSAAGCIVLVIPGNPPQVMKATEEMLITFHRPCEEVKVAAVKGVNDESLRKSLSHY